MSSTEKRGHQLGFCTVCQHRQLDSDFILTCNLTQKIADFESECPSFTIDLPTILKRRITQEKKLLDRFHPTLHHVEKFLNTTTTGLTNKEAFNNSLYKTTKKLVFRESDQLDLTMFILSPIVILVCMLYFILNPLQHIALLIAFIAFITTCFFGYRVLLYKYKVQLEITAYGLETPRENIPWSAIIDYYLSEKKQPKGESFYTLVILTSSGILKTILLNHLEVTPQMIVKKINQERKLYYHDSY